MKLGIIGLPKTGKTTVFEAITGDRASDGLKREHRIGMVKVPDNRVNVLSEIYHPKKTTYAQVEYFLPGKTEPKGKQQDLNVWTQVRDADALIHVIRNFSGYGLKPLSPGKDFRLLDQEMIFSDLVVVEKRLDHLELNRKRGKKIDPNEWALLTECRQSLENESPLRKHPVIANNLILKGFAFLSAKPMLVLFNNDDEINSVPHVENLTTLENCTFIRGKLEQELAQLPKEEASDFLKEFHIAEPATDRIIQQSYDLLGLVSFFTVGDDEVKAWTVKKETPALDAAGVIHSDMQKGFIRAEVLAFEDLMEAGSHAAARKKGTVRLEGKTYPVHDGDIINFRFNI